MTLSTMVIMAALICHWILLILFNMSTTVSVPGCDCFVEWYCRYVSAVIDVDLMCHLLWVICLPSVVGCIVYALSWWLWSPVPTIVPWVHGPQSSHWTTTADPTGIDENIGEASLLFLCCLSSSLLWWSSSQSCPIGLQSRIGMMPQTCLLNMSVARFGKPWLSGVVWICSRAIFMSSPESAHLLNVCFINLIHASTCPLLWWWYTNGIACFTLMVLQNWQNLSETKFVPAYDFCCGD